jgi:Kelch motif protein
MNATRAGQTATRLNDDTVLIAGGFDGSGAAQNTAEIFDPVQVHVHAGRDPDA